VEDDERVIGMSLERKDSRVIVQYLWIEKNLGHHS